jgi:hypothetical protein
MPLVNELAVQTCMKRHEFPDKLKDYLLLKKHSVSASYYYKSDHQSVTFFQFISTYETGEHTSEQGTLIIQFTHLSLVEICELNYENIWI